MNFWENYNCGDWKEMGFKLQILPSFFKKKNNLSSFSTVKLPSQKGFSKHILRRIFDANFQPLARIAKSVSNKFNLRPRYFMLPRIRGRFLLRVITSERGVLKPGSERKILVEASRARSTPKKMWKKRKEIGNERLEPRGTRAIPRENCDSFFREPASGFSHAFLRNYRCQDYREGRLLRLLFCSRIWWTPAPGTANIWPRVYDSCLCFPPNDFRPVDFDTMISTHAVGIGYDVIVSIREDRLRNCIPKSWCEGISREGR